MEQASDEITVRHIDLSDVDDFMAWASDDLATAFCQYDSYTDKANLLRYMGEVVLPHPWFRAVCLGRRAIGSISVTVGAGCRRCKGEIGYVLAAAHWGRGYATAAVRLSVAAVFEEVEGLERVEALVDVENGASQRVVEKAGFTREGVLKKAAVLKGKTRDLAIYSILNTRESGGLG